MAGALIAGFISSMLGSSRADREKEIKQWTNRSKFIEPVQINREMSLEGILLSYDKFGKPRDTGTSAFPIPIQQNRYVPNFLDADNPIYLPGRVLDTPSNYVIDWGVGLKTLGKTSPGMSISERFHCNPA